MAYCTNADVTNRLSSIGILYLVDDDNDGVLDVSEDAYVTEAISYATTEIAESLAPWFDDPFAVTTNAWITDRCVDLACERICGRKGQDPPAIILQAAQAAREKLEKARSGRHAPDGLRIPGLIYPGDTDTLKNQIYGKPIITTPRR